MADKIIDEQLVGAPATEENLTLAIEHAVELAKREGKFIPKNIWALLKKRKEEGTFQGEIETLIPKTIVNLTSGEHYYEIEDVRKRSIVCRTCEVRHGGILEAHMLSRYKVEKGVLYLDNKPTNKVPLDRGKLE
jgi:hypothetical protein